MAQLKSPVRIVGLVRVVKSIRQQLATGVTPNQKGEIVHWVNNALNQVDSICGQHNISPDHLPKPTLLAYQFLRSLDFMNFPMKVVIQNSPASIKTSKPGNSRHNIQACILSLAEIKSSHNQALGSNSPEIVQINTLIKDRLSRINKAVKNKGGSIAGLAGVLLHEYQWLKFLEDPTNLLQHIISLSTVLKEFNDFKIHQKTPVKNALPLALLIHFYNCTGLYHIKYHKSHAELTLHEGFVGAPVSVFQALIKSMFSAKSKKNSTTIKAYANSNEFRNITLGMANTVPVDKSSAQGKAYNLFTVFDRVNLEYFMGKITAPRLTWNKRKTFRKFGHYIPASDTVMISISLDDRTVPLYVIEYVMYHELLHYQLGLRVSGSKVYAHTAEFHFAERQFKYYREAQSFLHSLAGHHQKSR